MSSVKSYCSAYSLLCGKSGGNERVGYKIFEKLMHVVSANFLPPSNQDIVY